MSAVPGITIASGSPVSPGGLRGPAGANLPPGVIVDYVGAVAPWGFLLCDGALHPTEDYPDLFDLIGYTFGGSGPDFAVPTRAEQIIKT